MTCIKGEDLLKNNLNLIYNVGRGSSCAPMMINLAYKNSDSTEYTALVGKGIVFDAGGINIKPSGGFLEIMFIDKCGAADVLAVFRAAV